MARTFHKRLSKTILLCPSTASHQKTSTSTSIEYVLVPVQVWSNEWVQLHKLRSAICIYIVNTKHYFTRKTSHSIYYSPPAETPGVQTKRASPFLHWGIAKPSANEARLLFPFELPPWRTSCLKTSVQVGHTWPIGDIFKASPGRFLEGWRVALDELEEFPGMTCLCSVLCYLSLMEETKQEEWIKTSQDLRCCRISVLGVTVQWPVPPVCHYSHLKESARLPLKTTPPPFRSKQLHHHRHGPPPRRPNRRAF